MKRSYLLVWLQYLAALILSLLVFAVVWRWWAADLRIPFSYTDDFTFGLGLVKGIIQTGWIYQNPLIGAPFGTNLYDFPIPDNLLVGMLRILTLFSHNPFLVFNLFYIIGFPLTALTSLYALKTLKLPFYLALPGALAVTFLPYHFLRINHTFLSEYFMLPLAISLAVRIMQGELEIFSWDIRTRRFKVAWRSPSTWGALLICILTASTGVYYAVFCGFVMGIAVLKCLLTEVKTLRLAGSLTGILLAVLLGGTLLANSLPYLMYASAHPSSDPILVRRPVEAEYYGLKLIQMLLPRPDHQIAVMGRLNQFYQTEFGDNNENTFASLGLIGALGFLASLGILMKDSSNPNDPLKSLSALNLACFLLGTVGGFAALVTYLVTPEIRSVNRISVLIGFLSIAVVCFLLQRFLSFASRLLRGQHARLTLAVKVLVVIAIVGVVYVDQCGQPVSNADYTQARAALEEDTSFIQGIEASLPRGAQVFELPYLAFPEGGHHHNLSDYDLLKPYLLSDQLHWSFGGTSGRLAGQWSRDITALPVETMLHSLAAAGFSGIYIDRGGYTADEDITLENELQRLLGTLPREETVQPRVYYDIRAYAAAYKASLSPAAWDQWVNHVMFPIYRNVALIFTGHFYAPVSLDGVQTRRSSSHSGLTLQNLSAQDQTVELSFDIATSTNKPANFTIASSVWSKTYPIDGKPRTLQREAVIPAGQTLTISFSCDGDPYLLPNGDPHEYVFQVSNVSYRYKD